MEEIKTELHLSGLEENSSVSLDSSTSLDVSDAPSISNVIKEASVSADENENENDITSPQKNK